MAKKLPSYQIKRLISHSAVTCLQCAKSFMVDNQAVKHSMTNQSAKRLRSKQFTEMNNNLIDQLIGDDDDSSNVDKVIEKWV